MNGNAKKGRGGFPANFMPPDFSVDPRARPRAPDTGGESFHFALSSVSVMGTLQNGKGTNGAEIAAAHQRYLERPGSVELNFNENDGYSYWGDPFHYHE